MSKELAIQTENTSSMQSYCFANAQAFEAAQRMATALSKATLVPKEYQNNIANCIIALEVAHRMNASPTMVMQNLYIVHGRPSWSSQFIISAVNSCGRFRPLRFEMLGKEGGDDRSCIAWTIEKNIELPKDVQTLADAKAAKLAILESPRISIDMAKKEGWYGKNGSKWQTMPELMLRYRSASFFGRLYAPEILMGMQSAEESEDIAPVRDVTPRDNSGLQNAFMNNEVSVTSAGDTTPNALDALLSGSSEVKQEETFFTALLMPDGEVKKFPDELDTVGLMSELQGMIPPDMEKFVEDNKNALKQVAEFMRTDGKPKAAEQIEKMIGAK